MIKKIFSKIFYIVLIILSLTILLTVGLFYLNENFKYYDVIIGYILWKFIPFISTPINIP